MISSLFGPNILLSAPFLNILHVLPLMPKTKFHTHSKQQKYNIHNIRTTILKRQLCIMFSCNTKDPLFRNMFISLLL
jgi:hypothetical protein